MTSVIDAVLAGGDGDGAVGGHDADLAQEASGIGGDCL
jgi:hypothetical protein